MKVILTIKPHGKTITEILTVLSLVVPQLEAVGVVSFDTQDDDVVPMQPSPQLPEVLPDDPEALDQERERLKSMSVSKPQQPPMTKEEEPAMVDLVTDPRSKQKRVVG